MTALQSVEKGVDTLTDTLGRIQKLELEPGLEGLAYTDLDDSRAAFRLDCCRTAASRATASTGSSW